MVYFSGISEYKGRAVQNYFLIQTLTPEQTLLLCVNLGWYIIKINFLLHFHLRTFWAYSDRRSRCRGFCTALYKGLEKFIKGNSTPPHTFSHFYTFKKHLRQKLTFVHKCWGAVASLDTKIAIIGWHITTAWTSAFTPSKLGFG